MKASSINPILIQFVTGQASHLAPGGILTGLIQES